MTAQNDPERGRRRPLPRPVMATPKPPPEPAIQRAAVVIAFGLSAVIGGFLVYLLALFAIWLTRVVLG
jgi:hypothetical protein